MNRFIRLSGYVNSDPTFTDQPMVINAASDMLANIFGDAGKHSRLAVGVCSLPLGSAVEIEFLVKSDTDVTTFHRLNASIRNFRFPKPSEHGDQRSISGRLYFLISYSGVFIYKLIPSFSNQRNHLFNQNGIIVLCIHVQC